MFIRWMNKDVPLAGNESDDFFFFTRCRFESYLPRYKQGEVKLEMVNTFMVLSLVFLTGISLYGLTNYMQKESQRVRVPEKAKRDRLP
jgi:hypothetical protein